MKEAGAWAPPKRLRDLSAAEKRYIIDRIICAFPCLAGHERDIFKDASASLVQRRNDLNNKSNWTSPLHARHQPQVSSSSLKRHYSVVDLLRDGKDVARGELVSKGMPFCKVIVSDIFDNCHEAPLPEAVNGLLLLSEVQPGAEIRWWAKKINYRVKLTPVVQKTKPQP